MTAAANRLEKKGLVKRIQDPSDGRCFYVHLTKEGLCVIMTAFSQHEKNLDRIAEALPPQEYDDLVRLLNKNPSFAKGSIK
jgi:DNA-binding MarR family transcriptional regulator